MALPQQKFREIVFQLLYSHDFTQMTGDETIPLMMDMLAVSKSNMLRARERGTQIEEKKKEIDALISEHSRSYDFNRISRVEKNILRLAVYELIYDHDMPAKVAIAEAIRICRKFGTGEGANFVNAVLDALYQSSLKKESEGSL